MDRTAPEPTLLAEAAALASTNPPEQSHCATSLLPTATVDECSGHWTHANWVVLPSKGLYESRAQGIGAVLPRGDQLPAGTRLQACAAARPSWAEAVPAGQGVGTVEPRGQ